MAEAVIQASVMSGPKMQLSIDPKDAIRLVGRLLAHPEFDQLFKATNGLIKTRPDVLRNVQSLLARKLQAMDANTFTGSPINLQGLASALLSPVDTGGLGNLGDPAWAVRLDKDGTYASRVSVKLGRTSVNSIQILQGLNVGDKVIISDMSQWDNVERVKLK